MTNKEELYLELGKITFEKLDALSQSEGEDTLELDFFLSDSYILELLNQISFIEQETVAVSELVAESDLPVEKAIIEEPLAQKSVCSKCNTPVSADSKFCNVCGHNLLEVQQTNPQCPHCGKNIRFGAIFCIICGKKI